MLLGAVGAVVEHVGGTVEDAAAFLVEAGGGRATWQVYEMLQDLCGSRMLVDKTPANGDHPMIIRRAREVFAAPLYLHLVRHPYAAISSGVQLSRDILGNLDVTWAGVEQAWLNNTVSTRDVLLALDPALKMTLRCVDLCNIDTAVVPRVRVAARANQFLCKQTPPPPFPRYEQLVREPEAATRRICTELLHVAWEPSMAQPYTTKSKDSFRAPRANNSFSTTDPKLLRRKTIEAASADKWREVVLPKPLQASTQVAAKLLGYELLHEHMAEELVWLSQTGLASRKQPILLVHDFTGMLWGFDRLVKALTDPIVGMQCSKRLVDRCVSFHELALKYVRQLPPVSLGPGQVRLMAYSLGCRIAYRMACILEQEGECVQLVLLDGPVGPASFGPLRMGGNATHVQEMIRRFAVEREAATEMKSLTDLDVNQNPFYRLAANLAESGEPAEVAISLLGLLDDDTSPPVQAAALYLSAARSKNLTNGTLETAVCCLHHLEHVIVDGDHFDFFQLSATEIAEYISRFFEACD